MQPVLVTNPETIMFGSEICVLVKNGITIDAKNINPKLLIISDKRSNCSEFNLGIDIIR